MAERILQTDSPREQKALGRKVAHFEEGKWKSCCRDIVKKGNLAKVWSTFHSWAGKDLGHFVIVIDQDGLIDRKWLLSTKLSTKAQQLGQPETEQHCHDLSPMVSKHVYQTPAVIQTTTAMQGDGS